MPTERTDVKEVSPKPFHGAQGLPQPNKGKSWTAKFRRKSSEEHQHEKKVT